MFWNVLVSVILLSTFWSLRHFTGHLDHITLGFVDVQASEKEIYYRYKLK